MSSYPNKQNYTIDETTLQDVLIYEYDMNKSGLSLLKEYSDLDKSIISRLEHLDKFERNVEIGNIMKSNKDYFNAVEKNIKIVMQEFFKVNEIELSNIVSIKRDAVFSTKKCTILQLSENITFKLVDTYSSFYRFGNVEFYYSEKNKSFIYKGLGENCVENNLFLKEFSKLIKLLEKATPQNRFRLLQDFRKDYCSKKFDIEMYRECNPKNLFRLKDINKNVNGFEFFAEGYNDKEEIDGIYNYNKFIVPIIKTFTT